MSRPSLIQVRAQLFGTHLKLAILVGRNCTPIKKLFHPLNVNKVHLPEYITLYKNQKVLYWFFQSQACQPLATHHGPVCAKYRLVTSTVA